MQAIVIREHGEKGVGSRGLLRYALSTSPLNQVLLEGLDHLWRGRASDDSAEAAGWAGPRKARWVLPRAWQAEVPGDLLPVRSAGDSQTDRVAGLEGQPDRSWVVVTDGRYATNVNHDLLARVLATVDADVIAVNAASSLLAYRERIRLTPNKELVGYRRMFADSVSPMPMPADWPHHLWVRPKAFDAVVGPNLLADFRTVLERCRTAGLTMRGIAVAGAAVDLESEEGILAVCNAVLNSTPRGGADALRTTDRPAPGSDGAAVLSEGPRFIGPVRRGGHVTVEPGAVVVGPAILCDGCVIGRDAVVDSSIVGARVSVGSGRVLRSRLAVEAERPGDRDPVADASREEGWFQELSWGHQEDAFRTWPRFSYPRCLKRIADAVMAAVVLALFAPVIPVIAMAVKLSSPGPIFFRDKRQGFHGKAFDCIKFRTMRQGADKMQDKLRFVCEVDGPQFKMADDPRITAVGRFLRETYLDEIPQFYNVLCGQMSVVGPRPSPESENTLCPSWRDARLSVRPGITGLWQVCRTRAAHKDFQEWIQYDTKYVRDLSPRLDLWICWRTFRRMVENFVNQF
ncbi:MAG: sugar transferase [Solirubrobacterales bacterium]